MEMWFTSLIGRIGDLQALRDAAERQGSQRSCTVILGRTKEEIGL